MNLRHRSIYVCALALALLPGTAAWADNLAILQLSNFVQYGEVMYDFESYYGKNQNGTTSERYRNAPEQHYEFDLNYAVYSSRLLQGAARIGAAARQQFDSGDISGQTDDWRLNYDVTGTFFRAHPCPISFNLDSSRQRVNPSFSRSYDLKTDQYGSTFMIRNRFLPATITYSHIANESSGLPVDHRDTLETIGINVSHSGTISSTAGSLQTQRGYTLLLNNSSAPEDHTVLSGSLSNMLQLSRNADLVRTLNSTYTYSRDGGGTNSSKFADLRENLSWDLGKALKFRFDGELNNTSTLDQNRQSLQGRANLDHRLIETVTTHLFGDANQSEVNGGKERGAGGGVKFTYNRILPRESSFLADYLYSFHVTDNNTGVDTMFFRDEGHTASAVETENYLIRSDIEPDSIVVWNATRTRQYIGKLYDGSGGLDYTIVQDGRRFRMRIEPSGSINIGDPLLVDYRVRTNPQVKYGTNTHSAGASLNLWQSYIISATWSYSVDRVLSGQAEVPLTSTSSWGAKLEHVIPFYRMGLNYTSTDSNSAKYQKVDSFVRYNREFSEQTSLSASLSDIVSIYRPTVTSVLNQQVTSEAGTTNELAADLYYRWPITERVQGSATGQYSKSSGRSTNQQVFSAWLRGKYKGPLLESVATIRADWRVFSSSTQRDVSLALDLKRYW